ncbi:MAG: ATP-binding protein, partial [Chloroflexota bacterium]|nr:ATP-binding protein [Chloroflexota bacterium]
MNRSRYDRATEHHQHMVADDAAGQVGGDASSGTRLSRIRIFSSVRFRLTAWYTLVLVVIIVVLGILLSVFLSRSLDEDVDRRLNDASEQVFEGSDSIALAGDAYVSASAGSLEEADIEPTSAFAALITSGLFAVTMDMNGDAFSRQGVVPQEALDLVDLGEISQGNTVFQTLSVNGQRVRIYSIPVVVQQLDSETSLSQNSVGAIVLGESLERQDHAIEILNQLLRVGGAVGILVATWSGWILAGRALAPVNRIANTANAIARKGDAQESLATRIDVGHNQDELARLAQTFNGMLERIERAFQAQRRFVADASHELRTPLTAIRGNVDVLLRALKSDRPIDSDDLRESLGDVQRESGRMARLIDDLLLLARTDAEGFGHMVHPEPVSLDIVAREAFRTAEALAHGQRLHLSVRQPLMIYGDGDRLVQVMIILMENAIRYTPAGGTVDLIIDAAEPGDGMETCARIKVVDSGAGIAPEHLPHLFERFYRVENSRSRQVGGSGLGLAIALAIVQGHNGWIDVESGPDSGTQFIVWLPILES